MSVPQTCLAGPLAGAMVGPGKEALNHMQVNNGVCPATTKLSARLAEWRAAHKPPSPIPSAIWARAAELAAEHGICKVSRALRLDYSRLKRLVGPAPSPPGRRGRPRRRPEPGSAATFVELLSPLACVISECAMEVETANQTRLRIECRNVAPLALSAIIKDLGI